MESDQSMVDLTNNEISDEQISQGVRIKMESEFPTVDPNAADVPTQDTPAPEPELGRGRRVRKQTQIFSPKFKGQSHDDATHGHIHITVQDGEELSCDKYYANCGYSTTRGVINLNLRDNVPPPKMSEEQIDAHLLGLALVNMYNIKKGQELFGERADAAVQKEIKEIDNFQTYEPLHAKDLTWEEKRKALEALFFLTEKRDRRMKGRKVAVGSRQRIYDGYEKSDGSSPTVTNDSIVLTGWSTHARDVT